MRTEIVGTPDVLIVGGGLAGLSCAAFLGMQGVKTVLVERRSSTSIYPKAAGQNPRTMELFHFAGLADAVLAVDDIRGGAGEFSIKVVETIPGRVLHSFAESFDELAGATKACSPRPWGMVAQDKLEPVLLDAARRSSVDVRFNTTLSRLVVEPTGEVSAHVQTSEHEQKVICPRYVVAADGPNSAIRRSLNIDRHGQGLISEFVTMLFEADISDFVGSDSTGWYYIQNDTFRGNFGPTDTPGRYTFYVESSSQTGAVDSARCVELLRLALEAPDLEPDVLDVQSWDMAAHVANRWRDGPVLLAGDAAKVTPPTGGMGGNSAVGDAFDIAWKLASVIHGGAGDRLLDSYALERRDAAELVVQESMAIYAQRMAPHLQKKIGPPRGQATVLLGSRCRSEAVVADAQDDEMCEDPSTSTGRAGFRAPHVWIEKDGQRLSTIDFFGLRWVVLVAQNAPYGWTHVVDQVTDELGVPLVLHRNGIEWTDIDDQVDERFGLEGSGVSLIRPDGVVAWRTGANSWSTERCSRELCSVLTRVLSIDA